jgi:Fic family protein
MQKPVFDRNQPFNELPMLPPVQEIDNDPLILKKLVSASRALAEVNGHILRLPNPYMLINTIALQEAKTSTEIENIFTTEDDLYKAISETTRNENVNPGTKEVLRYREALWAGYEAITRKEELDIQSIITIFQQIKLTKSGFRPPQALVNIKKSQSEFRTGEVIYTPPRGNELLDKLMNNLIEYLNNDMKYKTDPLLKMCISHYQFEAIHPFHDGNGRTGRILNLLYLIHKGLLSHPTLYLSKYIIHNKDDYYYLLQSVTLRQTWKEWVLFMLDAVEKTSRLTSNLINEILAQMEVTLRYARKNIKWYNKELNEALFSQPYIKAKTVGTLMGKTSRTTITKYMEQLTAANILSYQKNGTEVYYLNDDLIRILQG